MLEHIGRSCIVSDHSDEVFSALKSEERVYLQDHTSEIEYEKGDMILKQGVFLSHVIFLEHGLVKVFLEGKARDLILKIIPGGHFVDLPPVKDESVLSPYSVVAYEDCKVRLIELKAFREVLSSNAELGMRIINLMKEDATQIHHRFYCLMRKQSHGRVADVLLCLSEQVYKSRKIHLNLSRNDLADLTGLTTESLIRILKEFKDEGVIQVRAKDLQLIDFDALERIRNYS